MKKISKVIAVISGILLMVSLLLSIVDVLCFNRSFYEMEYQKGGNAEITGMSENDLMKATDTLLDYLQDKRDSIVVKAEVSGSEREVFNERETLHMQDVKQLYQNALTARNIMAVSGAVLLALLLWKEKNHRLEAVRYGFKLGFSMIAVFVTFIVIWAVADFDDFWIQFHYVFFDNTLFFLDPNTSIMINMFPDTFFFDLVIRIILWFGGILATASAVLYLPWKRIFKHA
jgi:integral membrane protein (TIGR01906 family)